MRVFAAILVCAITTAMFVAMFLENGHGHAWALAFSPNGRQLMVAYGNATVRLWDAWQEEVRPQRMALASDGTHWVSPSRVQFGGAGLLVAFRRSRDKGMPDGYELWDTAARRRVKIIALPYSAGMFQASAQGGVVLASAEAEPRTLDLFDLESGQRIASLDDSQSVPGHVRNQCVMSADGECVAASFYARDAGAVLSVWDARSGNCTRSLLIESGYRLLISRDGRLLVDNGRDVWDLQTGGRGASIDPGRYAHSNAALSADGLMLATASFETGRVRVWNTADGRLLAELHAADSPFDADRNTYAAFSPDGKSLATATGRTVRLWDTTSFQLKATLARGHRLAAAITCSLAFTIWSAACGLARRQKSGRTEIRRRSSRLLPPASALLGLAGLAAIVNSTFAVLHPALCGCCTPTALLLAVGCLQLGAGIFVLVQTFGQRPEGLVWATLVLIWSALIANFNPASAAVVICAGVALLFRGVAAARLRRPDPPADCRA